MMTLVRAVMARLTASGSMFNVSGSLSTKTGLALRYPTTSAVAAKVMVGKMTSSPSLTPIASNARCSAAVPEFALPHALCWHNLCKLVLELLGPLSRRQPAGLQGLRDRLNLFFSDLRKMKRNPSFSHGARAFEWLPDNAVPTAAALRLRADNQTMK